MAIDVNTATRQDLVDFCQTEGLKVPHNASKADIQAIVAKQLGVSVEAGSGDISKELGPEAKASFLEQQKQRKVRIRVFENKDHPPRIPVIVNGVPYTIVPGAEVEVPESVVGVLNDAIVTSYKQERDGEGFKLVAQKSLAYPFEVIRK